MKVIKMGIIDQTLLVNISTTKFVIFISGMLALHIICFIIAAFFAPNPSNIELALAGKCILNKTTDAWYIPWGGKDNEPVYCKPTYEKNENDQVVFAAEMPLQRNHIERWYSRWNQHMVAALYLDIFRRAGTLNNTMSKYPNFTMTVKLGSRKREDPANKWTLIAKETQRRQLRCSGNMRKDFENSINDCEELLLFELSSVSYNYYLVNIFISDLDSNIGFLEDIWIAIKIGNEEFVKTWLFLKAAFTPVIIISAISFRYCISKAERSPIASERMLLCLCVVLTFVNLPVEFITLLLDVCCMTLLTKIREIIFYGVLFGYWLWFHGYYLMVKEKSEMKSLWIFISVIAFVCICHLVFDMYTRSLDLRNPFANIWINVTGANWGLVFTFIFAGCSFIYLVSSFYFICRATCYFGKKLTERNQECSGHHRKGIFLRFVVLSAVTILCSVITILSYITKQVSDGYWKWNHYQIDYFGVIYNGAYATWNIYTLIHIILYSTSTCFCSTGHDALLSETETPPLDAATEL